MKQSYTISGMTCQGCLTSVREQLLRVTNVQGVELDLDSGRAEVSMMEHISLDELKGALSEKYGIEEMKDQVIQKSQLEEKSKWQQLKPLFLIFGYLFAAAILMNYKYWNTTEAMLDFMGLFYIVFSFFKFLDLKGFPESFRMYDPLAKALPIYGWVYPFLELGLGLLFLMRFQIEMALITTIVILAITTIGVTKTLLDKKSIRCACLGTALKLPMTEATFIENAIMLVMAFVMLFQFAA